MYYILLLFIMLIIHILFMNNINKKTELVLLMMILFIFIGFRDSSVGTDTHIYTNTFISFQGTDLSTVLNNSSLERGYLIFAWALVQILPFKQSLLIAQGLIAIIPLYKLIKEESDDYFFSVLVFMSFGLLGFYMTGIRQSFAISLTILSYAYSLNKKNFLSLFFWSLAISFHTSAIVFGLFYIYGVIWKKKNNLFFAIIVMVIFVANLSFINRYISELFNRWEMYAELEETSSGLVYFVILIVCCVLMEYVKREFTDQEDMLRRVNYVTLILWAGRLVSRTFERPAMYFYPCNVILFPNALKKIKDDRNRRILYFFAILFTIALYIYRFYQKDYSFMRF